MRGKGGERDSLREVGEKGREGRVSGLESQACFVQGSRSAARFFVWTLRFFSHQRSVCAEFLSVGIEDGGPDVDGVRARYVGLSGVELCRTSP